MCGEKCVANYNAVLHILSVVVLKVIKYVYCNYHTASYEWI